MAFPSDSVRTKNWGTETLTDADLEAQFDLLHNYIKAMLDSSTGHDHSGTSNQSKKLTPANLVIASQAAADLLVASSSSAWKRLAKGTASQVLKMKIDASDIEWVDISASQADQEAKTEALKYVAPATQQFHPSSAKAWVRFNGTGASPITVTSSYNVTGTVTKNGTGDYTITWETDFSNTTYLPMCHASNSAALGQSVVVVVKTIAADTLNILTLKGDTGAAYDVDTISVVCFGDQ
jgi:hypothetical protein